MHAASKTFNLAGLASSSVIIKDEALREQFKTYISRLHVDMGNLFGFVATQAAFEKGEAWLDEVLEYIAANVEWAIEYLKQNLPQVKMVVPEATYMIWLDFSEFGFADEELKEFLINKAGVGLNAGVDFGPGGEGFMRMNLACPRKIVETAFEKINVVFSELLSATKI
jgi:cystathionine beta-lyase